MKSKLILIIFPIDRSVINKCISYIVNGCKEARVGFRQSKYGIDVNNYRIRFIPNDPHYIIGIRSDYHHIYDDYFNDLNLYLTLQGSKILRDLDCVLEVILKEVY